MPRSTTDRTACRRWAAPAAAGRTCSAGWAVAGKAAHPLSIKPLRDTRRTRTAPTQARAVYLAPGMRLRLFIFRNAHAAPLCLFQPYAAAACTPLVPLTSSRAGNRLTHACLFSSSAAGVQPGQFATPLRVGGSPALAQQLYGPPSHPAGSAAALFGAPQRPWSANAFPELDEEDEGEEEAAGARRHAGGLQVGG